MANIEPPETGDQTAANPMGARFAFAGKLVLVAIPAAYVAGYIAWTYGARSMGFPFLSPDPVQTVSLGSVALFLMAGYVAAVVAGNLLMEASPDKPKPWRRTKAFAVAGLVGISLSYAVVAVLTPITGLDLWPAVIAAMGVGAMFPPWILALAILTSPERNHGSTRALQGIVAFGAGIILAGMVVGLAIAPSIPPSAGGFEPSPAVFHFAAAHLPTALANATGATADGDVLLVPVWVFSSNSGYLVRPACGDARSGPAFTIPDASVAAVQWLTEEGRVSRC